MAEEKKERKESKKPETEKAKKRIKGITHHIAEDGGYVHEHHYHGNPPTSSFGGYSPTLDDVHQHIDDHLGPGAMQAEEEPEGGGGGGEEEAAGGAPPAAGPAPGEAA